MVMVLSILEKKFQQISDAKLKEGIFIRWQIHIINDDLFDTWKLRNLYG